MSYEVERYEDEEHGTGLVAIVSYDEFCSDDNPRDWDNCWTILTNQGPHYNDIDGTLDPDNLATVDCEVCEGEGENVNVIDGIEFTTHCKACDGWGTRDQTLDEYLKTEYDAYMIVPVYKYEHGNCLYKAATGGNPFSCPWDSGMVGVAVIDKATVEKEWGIGYKDSQNLYDGEFHDAEWWALRYLDGELANYTAWANGEVYAITVENADGDVLESVGGFYDDSTGYVEQEAKGMLRNEVDALLTDRKAKMALANMIGWKR